MSTTLNNILGGGTRQTSPPTTPPPAAPDENMLTISDEEKKGISPAQAVQPAPTQQVEPQQPKRLSYEDMFRQLNPYKPPTQEELEKERKKQRREQIFAAIGDGISALSNLYFTTQYAPNMYSGRNTASQRVKDRWDKLAADRNANMTAYINGLMRARQADDAYDDNERQWARQLGLDKIKQQRDAAADARAEAEEERKKELHPYARASRARARYYDRGGSGGSKSKDMQEAYDYWMSLTDEQKNQYRDWNKRVKKYNSVYNRDTKKREQIPVYMDDDDNFIQMVWKQRQGWLNNPKNRTMPGVSDNKMPGVK